nr:sulfatase-like hydrolase/transferase [Devosia beringensis]
MGIFKPHSNWIVPQEYFDLYPLAQMALPLVLDNDRDDIPAYVDSIIGQNAQNTLEAAGEWPAAVQSYFASISFADAMVGRMLDAIEETGHSHDTAVMLWSDHGYHLGDKDTWHKFTLWEEAGRAPLIIKVPGNPNAGQVVSQPVELVDIAPTMLELAGVTATHEMSGRSLLPFVEDTSHVDGGVAITTMFGAASIRTEEMRYIRYPEGSEELYDIVADPHSWTNLASDPNYLLAKTSLRIDLETALKQDGWQWVTEGVGQPIEGANLMVLAPAAHGAVGGPGNDSYFIMSADATITEQPDSGYDTIYAAVSYELPANIEELQMSSLLVPMSLTGNEQDNKIAGFGQLYGLGGDDVLQSTGASTVEGGEGDDLLIGSKSSDVLIGGPGNDVLRGNDGDDRLIGGPGSDTLVGGPALDWADYSSSLGAIAVDMAGPTVTSGDDVDTISQIENFVGTNFDDEYRLGATDNKVVVGLGNDTVDGRAGSDTVILPVGPTEVKIIARPGKVDFVYHLDGATYRVTTQRVEFVEFADGTTQLLEKVEQSEPPLGDAPQ